MIAAMARADPNAHASWDTRRVREALDAMEPGSGLEGTPPGIVYRGQGTDHQEDRSKYSSHGIPVPKAVVAERPAWLPVNKYLHEGKEVVQISGSSVYGWRSTIHFADGSIQTQGSSDKSTYSALDGLIKRFGFVTYRQTEHERYYTGERFEAVPVEDPSEWEEHEFGFAGPASGVTTSGWRRKPGVEPKADG
jgi:hypothetical protein